MSRPNEYYFKEGCFIEEWHNTEKDQSMSVARVRVNIGQTTKLHSLDNTMERYVILAGQAEVTVNDLTTTVTEGDVVVIPAGETQRIENIDSQDLVFLAICTPRFQVQNYREREAN